MPEERRGKNLAELREERRSASTFRVFACSLFEAYVATKISVKHILQFAQVIFRLWISVEKPR
jgi:hypothetical protein